jgi:hypothetical protein
MMNLSFVWGRYDYYSKKASENVRQLGFAALALIWLFKVEVNGRWQLPRELLTPGAWIVGALVLDFIHYVLGTFLWAAFYWIKERTNTKESANFDAPRWLNWPTLVLFWAKIIATCIAYCLIIRFLYSRAILSGSVSGSIH